MASNSQKSGGVLDAQGVNELHKDWRQEVIILQEKVFTAIGTLDAMRKKYELTALICKGVVAAVAVISLFLFLYVSDNIHLEYKGIIFYKSSAMCK